MFDEKYLLEDDDLGEEDDLEMPVVDGDDDGDDDGDLFDDGDDDEVDGDLFGNDEDE